MFLDSVDDQSSQIRYVKGARHGFVPGAHHVLHDRIPIHGSDAADARGRCDLQHGQFRCPLGLLVVDCGIPCEVIGHISRGTAKV